MGYRHTFPSPPIAYHCKWFHFDWKEVLAYPDVKAVTKGPMTSAQIDLVLPILVSRYEDALKTRQHTYWLWVMNPYQVPMALICLHWLKDKRLYLIVEAMKPSDPEASQDTGRRVEHYNVSYFDGARETRVDEQIDREEFERLFVYPSPEVGRQIRGEVEAAFKALNEASERSL